MSNKKWKMGEIFVAFSEYLNLKSHKLIVGGLRTMGFHFWSKISSLSWLSLTFKQTAKECLKLTFKVRFTNTFIPKIQSKRMLTHCVYQLADFYLRSVRLITDTSFISEPSNFFLRIKFFFSPSFFHEPILTFVGFLGKAQSP